MTGAQADIRAATAIDPDIAAVFQQLGLSPATTSANAAVAQQLN